MATEKDKAAVKREQEYKARLGDYLKTFTTEAGKRILKDMRRQYCGHVFDKDPYQLAYNMGKRDVLKDIEAVLLLAKDPKKVDSLFKRPEDDGFEL